MLNLGLGYLRVALRPVCRLTTRLAGETGQLTEKNAPTLQEHGVQTVYFTALGWLPATNSMHKEQINGSIGYGETVKRRENLLRLDRDREEKNDRVSKVGDQTKRALKTPPNPTTRVMSSNEP
ncbi:hypothetical protein AG1IA_01239 [Rhizoctonia solani AG-1 IA]|uniref:Uncharacterized protein n=1 Tax=Thanatephorus cucumeris (strain AG1-IA) TaxID=983506 RepID=L8X6R0_THACA|nr:hypothetical protein AG1IA_01239 [Rhizoctonia solani AG-1 IA]